MPIIFLAMALPALIVLAFFAATLAAVARTLPAQNVVAATALALIRAWVGGNCRRKDWRSLRLVFLYRKSGPFVVQGFAMADSLDLGRVIFNSRGTARLVLRPWREAAHYGYWATALTCAIAVLFDAALEPIARANRFWFWRVSPSVPSWYGAPWINFVSWTAITLLILGIILPWLIDKKSGDKSPPDHPLLVLWILMMLVAAATSAAHSYWPAVVVDLGTTAADRFLCLAQFPAMIHPVDVFVSGFSASALRVNLQFRHAHPVHFLDAQFVRPRPAARSPSFGNPPSRCVTQPLTVVTPSSCNGSCTSSAQFMQRQRARHFPRLPRRSCISSGFSWSNSSWICPTSSSRIFSSVTIPTVPPYSSTTMAKCSLRSRNSCSSFSSRAVSGT